MSPDPRFTAAFEPLEHLVAAGGWRALAGAALEPNPYYEPDMLTAAARHLGRAGTMRLLAVREAPAGRLVALLPIQRPRLRDGILFGAWSLYANPYTSLTIPLIEAESAEPALRAALHRLAAGANAPDALHFPLVTEGRGFAALLARVAEAEGLACLVVERHARPAIHREGKTVEPSASRYRRLDRKARRLAMLGEVRAGTVHAGDPEFPAALADFLALEAAGWKGRRGTALACRPATDAYARQAFSGAGQQVMIERLDLDGRAIAMNLNLVSGRVVFTVKTAYDEAHAAASPGQLLDRHVAERFATAPDLDRADSCAQPDHPMGALWHDREPVATLLLGLSPALPEAALEPIAARMRLAARLRKGLRALRERLG